MADTGLQARCAGSVAVMEYEARRGLAVGKQAAYAVAADVERMAGWLPTAFEVVPNTDGTVHVEGSADGHAYAADGLWRARDSQLRLEWGSDEDGRYAGWMQFEGIEDDRCEAVLHLSFLGEQPQARRQDDEVRRGMEEALDRLAAEVEKPG